MDLKSVSTLLTTLTEGLVFSAQPISIDLDKFESGEATKLLIVGLSGAGKTTLGKKLAKRYGAKFEQLDMCWGEPAKQAPGVFEDPGEEFYETNYVPCIMKALTSPERSVLDGIGLIDMALDEPERFSFIHDLPIIMLGQSVVRAAYQAWRREFPWVYEYIKARRIKPLLPFMHLRSNLDIEKYYKRFREERLRRGGNVQPFNVSETRGHHS